MRLEFLNRYDDRGTSTYNLLDEHGQAVGYAQIRSRASCADELPAEAASNIYYEIDQAHQGRGYGKALMGLVLAEAKRMGLGKVRIAVNDDNPTSRHIIQSHGARFLATFRREGGADTHLFEIAFT